MWPWHTSLLLLLGRGPAGWFPPPAGPPFLPPPYSSWQQPTSAGREQRPGCSLCCLSRLVSSSLCHLSRLVSSSLCHLSGSVSRRSHLLLGTRSFSPAEHGSHPLAACPCIGKAPIVPLPRLWAGSLSSSLTSCFPAVLRPAVLPPKKRNSLQYFLKDEI